jgi:hypothetical protein
MARPPGSKNKPKFDDLEKMELNAQNFLKIQEIRADYLSRIDALKVEIAKVDKAMVRFADWMDSESKRIRQQAKGG